MAFGWQIEELREKSLEKEIYEEMLSDFFYSAPKEIAISRAQFKRALNHFNFSNYKEELNMILYFGNLVSSLDLELPNPILNSYEESDIVNLAKIYMRRNEPNDYPYFRKITNNQGRIQFCYCAPKTSFLGKTYFLNSENYYILINSVNGIQDAITLLHESSHVENYLKYGMNLSKYFAELPAITREHYGFDMFRTFDNSIEVEKQRNLSLNHYLVRAIKLYNAILLILEMQKNASQTKQILTDFDEFSKYIDVEYLYGLLSSNLETEIGYTLSFIASLDIYSHCSPKESNLFITSYQIGSRNVTLKIIDRVVPYIMTTLGPYQKEKMI